MNRLPSPFTTNCAGIMRSLSMNCSRPSGQHMAGNHHASSSRSVEPPTFSPARIPSPMEAGLPKLQSFSSTGRCCLRHDMSWSNPPLARITPRRAWMRRWRPSCSTTAPVTEHPRPEHPPDQLHQNSFAPPVLAYLVEQPKVLGGEPNTLGRQRQRVQQILFLVAQLAQIYRRHVDG